MPKGYTQKQEQPFGIFNNCDDQILFSALNRILVLHFYDILDKIILHFGNIIVVMEALS